MEMLTLRKHPRLKHQPGPEVDAIYLVRNTRRGVAGEGGEKDGRRQRDLHVREKEGVRARIQEKGRSGGGAAESRRARGSKGEGEEGGVDARGEDGGGRSLLGRVHI